MTTYQRALVKNFNEVKSALYQMRVDAYKGTHGTCNVEEFTQYKTIHEAEDMRLTMALAKRITAEEACAPAVPVLNYENGEMVLGPDEDAQDAHIFNTYDLPEDWRV